ncbi:uncharacterized protein LOC128185761 [Crassostrea angulata]|uniref:uncharacterized protein LOC128185761 n=1 Tax=Magallana angulata TaxID=2784310 RepID=UPI0022B14887|nr:uncharacterized protein LOC128185761 [Crassostrea angulata]
MKFQDAVYCFILLLLHVCNIGETVGLLVHGNTGNLTDNIHGFPGQNIDLADMMQMLLNQTAELDIMKQQTAAEIENLKQKTAEIEHLKQQTASDQTTIQSLQNRVFFLEAELNKLNVSKLPSIQEFSTYLSSMNQLTHNMATNEANDRNLTQRLDVAVKSLDDLKVQVRYTSLSLLDIRQSMTDELNGTLQAIQLVEDRVTEHIKNVSKKIGFTASISSASSTWKSGTLVFPVVITNFGNGYNSRTGVFTAPITGEYVFFVNVQAYSSYTIYVDVVLNGVIQVRTFASGDSYNTYNAGPNLAVLTLQKEDRVWIQYYTGQGYHSDSGHITTFSGFLLQN